MMAERLAVTLVIFTVVLGICLYIFEMFVPLSKNMDFRDACRVYLVRMEQNSGLLDDDMAALASRLETMGFEDVGVTAPSHAKVGEVMTLKVNATFRMQVMSGILARGMKEYAMEYARDVVSRRVFN
ncbi:MAG: hypothetical protein R6W96_05800 [Clostridia bacterium]